MREEGRKYTHNGEAQYSTDGGEKPKAYRNAAETGTIKKKNVLVWQVNTDRARATHDLIHALTRTNNVDIVVYNELNKKMAARHKWCIDRRVDVAIDVISNELPIIRQGQGDGYAWVELRECTIYGCYISPNITIDSFEVYLYRIHTDTMKQGKPIIIAGDFNAKSPMWGSPTEDRRGAILTEWIGQINLTILNSGTKPTFERNSRGSFIDLTMCTSNMVSKIGDWRVLQEETLGCHKILEYTIKDVRDVGIRKTKFRGWRITEGTIEIFKEHLKKNMEERATKPRTTEEEGELGILYECLKKRCNAAFTKKIIRPNGKQTVYWWNSEIKEHRRECLRKRRTMTRTNKRGTTDERTKAVRGYRDARILSKMLLENPRRTSGTSCCGN